MLHLSSILSSAWTSDDWQKLLTTVSITFIPALIALIYAFKANNKSDIANTKADSLQNAHNENRQDIRQLNADQTSLAQAMPVVPVVVATADKPATEKTLNDVKTAVQDLPHSDKPPMQVRT